MKKISLWIFAALFLTLLLTSCKVVDPVTGEKAHDSLRSLMTDIFEAGPPDPWDSRGEFETTASYERRLAQQKQDYLVNSDRYYQQVGQNTYYIIHKIEELPEFNADSGSYDISFDLTTAQPITGSDTAGPDFRLFVPPQVVEEIHLFNESRLFPGIGWLRAEAGGLAHMTYSAVMGVNYAARLRQASGSLDVYLRVGVRFEFPQTYQGYRFLPERYSPFQDKESYIHDSPMVKQLKEEDLSYAASEGLVIIKLVSIEIVDEDGESYHKWPSSLAPARTPTPVGTKSPTPLPTSVLGVEEQEPSQTPQATENGFCPDAMPMRMEVGKKGRVTYGDPRRVRVRVEPSITADVIRLLNLGKEFQVIGGPVCADGYVWWEIKFTWFTRTYTGYWVAEGKDGNYHIEPME